LEDKKIDKEDYEYLQVYQELLIFLLRYEAYVKTHNTRLEKLDLYNGKISIDHEISQEDIEDNLIILDLAPSQMIKDERNYDMLLKVSHSPLQDSTYEILAYLVRLSNSEFHHKVIKSKIFDYVIEPDHVSNEFIK
jgi:hypothetical protein